MRPIDKRIWPRDYLVGAALMALALVSAGPVLAASSDGRIVASTEKSATNVVTAQGFEPDVSSSSDDGKTCDQSRKRLFVAGEGWIVRRVTTCY